MQEEIWKDIPGYEDYSVSNFGNFISYRRNRVLRLKGSIEKGYLKICLTNENGRKVFGAHQLVAMAFLNHKPDGMNCVIDHKNDNPLDNRASNLQIVTSRFNSYKTQGKYSSKYKGVHFIVKTGRFQARITINGLRKSLGVYECEYEASLAYENAVIEYNKENNIFNFEV